MKALLFPLLVDFLSIYYTCTPRPHEVQLSNNEVGSGVLCVPGLSKACIGGLLQKGLVSELFGGKRLEAFSVWRFVSLKRLGLTSCILSVKLGGFHCWPILGRERQTHLLGMT